MIYLLRHGLDDERYIGGWSEVSLTLEGIEQVKRASEFLKTKKDAINKIISSDIRRARETALLVGDSLQKDVEYTKILRELNKGKLNGLLKETIPSEYEMYKGNVDIETIYPDGESMKEFYLRIKSSLNEILSFDNTLLVTHRGVINMLYFILNDIELSNDKEKFGVTHASVHELDPVKLTIKRIY